jgi:F-type H+-transporting ATPase subunit delta
VKVTKQARREATELFRFCLVNGLLDENRVRQVVRYIVAAKPRGYLGTLSHFGRLVKLDSAQHAAKVESAVALSPELRAAVETSLTGTYGRGLSAHFVENPALIGGLRIQVGSDVYDGSVRARLASLEQSF